MLAEFFAGCDVFRAAMKKAAIQLALRNWSYRQLWALPCLLLFLALQPFAGSEVLHQAIHSDANSPAHHCAITLLTQGQVSPPLVPSLWIAFAATLIFFLPPFKTAAFSSFDYRLCSSRAPPCF